MNLLGVTGGVYQSGVEYMSNDPSNESAGRAPLDFFKDPSPHQDELCTLLAENFHIIENRFC